MKDKFTGAMLCTLILSITGSTAFAAVQSEEYKKGAELIEKRAYQDAIPYFDKAIQADPKHSDAYLDRALCNYHLGNYQKVLDDCKEVSGHNGVHEVIKRQALMMSAGAQNALGSYSDAVKACDEALALSPHASLCFSDRAFAYKQLKRYDEALRDCNEAIKLDPKHASNYELRASIYEAMAAGDRAKFKELLQTRKPGDKPWEKMQTEKK